MAGTDKNEFYGLSLTYKVIRELEMIQDVLTIQELINNIGAKNQPGIYKRVLNLIKGLSRINVCEVKKVPTEIPGLTFYVIKKNSIK